MGNEQKIYSQKLALTLIHEGCKLLGVEPNPNKPEYDVYIFENSSKLQLVMYLYTKLKKKD